MSPSQQFSARLGIQYPIIQAPMAGVSTPGLAAAVSNAGGLGSLGLGASAAAQSRQMIVETRAMSGKPFNVNVFCHAPARRDATAEAAWINHLSPLLTEYGVQIPSSLAEIYKTFNDDEATYRLLLELRPAVLSFHFGLPSRERLDALRAAGIYTMATATSVAEALLIENAGIDAIVAQGSRRAGTLACSIQTRPTNG